MEVEVRWEVFGVAGGLDKQLWMLRAHEVR